MPEAGSREMQGPGADVAPEPANAIEKGIP